MKKRILRGDRTTGRGKLQEDDETLVLPADVQTLTTHLENPSLIAQSILDVEMDNPAAGLKPRRFALFGSPEFHLRPGIPYIRSFVR